MKAYEVKKGDVEMDRGRIMMAIEGEQHCVEQIVEAMKSEGYYSTQCSEYGDKDGDMIEYFIIGRGNKNDFVQTYKSFK